MRSISTFYGHSRRFDRVLTRAQRDQIIRFPNPLYDTIAIRYDDTTRNAILNKLGFVPTLRHLADILVDHLEREGSAS